MRRRVIIDTDPGIDDALALVLALACTDEIEVIGVTITHGNSHDVDMLARNACYILEECGQKGIPVVKGAKYAMRPEFAVLSDLTVRIHGNNALGNIELKEPPLHALAHAYHDSESAKKMCRHTENAAAQFIIDQSEKHTDVTVIAIGPLTNVAEALTACPPVAKRLASIVTMGGALDHIGNRSPVAEANVADDPFAARIVYHSGADVVIVPLNITRQVSMTSEFLSSLNTTCGGIGEALHRMVLHYRDVLTQLGSTACPMHDPVAVLFVACPSLFGRGAVPLYVDVECVGELTRGMTVADWTGRCGKKPNVRAIVDVDFRGCLTYFLEKVGLFSRKQAPLKMDKW
eukprot:Opistho-1_new@65943